MVHHTTVFTLVFASGRAWKMENKTLTTKREEERRIEKKKGFYRKKKKREQNRVRWIQKVCHEFRGIVGRNGVKMNS